MQMTLETFAPTLVLSLACRPWRRRRCEAPSQVGGSAPASVINSTKHAIPRDASLQVTYSVHAFVTPAAAAPGVVAAVEDVRRKLALLAADQAVADVAGAWLADWEAPAVVDLLLQLDSPTTAARAVELFEWLRGLAPDSPQAHLCTPGTYAAMIGLYGRWGRPKQVSLGWLAFSPAMPVQALLPSCAKHCTATMP
jgi:hypothetical protein